MSQNTVTKNCGPSDTTAENRSITDPELTTGHELSQKRRKIDGESLDLEKRGVLITPIRLEPNANDDESRFVKSFIEKRVKLPQDDKIRTLDLYGSEPILMWIPIRVQKKTGSTSNEFSPN